jgi:prolyl 4-hydroxylase
MSWFVVTLPLMSIQINFSTELRGWLLHNLERGCSEQAIVESMVAQKFNSHIASSLVAAFIRARQQGIELPIGAIEIDTPEESYQYETPRIASGSIIHTADKDIPVLLRMEQPIITVLANVLSSDECDQLIDLARGRLKPSTVVDPETGLDKIAEHRDSEGMFFKLNENAFITKLDKRIAELMNCPVGNGEGLQVLRYGVKAKNTPHFDFLLPSNQSNRDSLARSGQRISTLVVYLNNVESGGETVFPELGLSVLPIKGNAVYFEYANSHRQVDPKSVHAGAPVYAGEKWAVTKWMRERQFIAQS